MKIFLTFFSFFFCIFIFSCLFPIASYTHHPIISTTPRIIPIYMDINFSHEDQIAIEDALNQWNFSLNGVEKFVVNDDKFDMDPDEIKQIYEKNGVMILKIDSSNPQVESGDLAFVNDLGGDQIFVIRDRIDNERDLTGILLHEIGHILGAQHSTLGIMRPTYHSETVNCIDFFVIDQIAYKWGYDPMQFNYCVIN